MRILAVTTMLSALFLAVGGLAIAQDELSSLPAGKWISDGDKTLVITYFRQRYPRSETDDIVGLLLINHSNAPKQARVYCYDDWAHFRDGSTAFRFTLNLKPSENRQLYAQNEIIRGLSSIACRFEEMAGPVIMKGTPPGPPPANRPRGLNKPPDPVFEWSPEAFNQPEGREKE